jgi:hypothetical protein
MGLTGIKLCLEMVCYCNTTVESGEGYSNYEITTLGGMSGNKMR